MSDLRRSLGAVDAEQPGEIAARGVAGGASALPHLDRIQVSFGRHDVAGVRSHLDPAAGRAARALSAHAYATGEDVAFDGAPSLFTAAHEAAHVIQQRSGLRPAGGIDEPGDPFERHADEVAAGVVAGASVEHLLDPFAGLGGGSASRAIQRQQIVVRDGRWSLRHWTPYWPAIHARAMQVASSAPLLQQITPAQLASGANVPLQVPGQPPGHVIRLHFATTPYVEGASDGGTTQPHVPETRGGAVVHRFDVTVRRSADVPRIIGAVDERTARAANRDHAALQLRLDDQVAEALAHELTHLQLAIETQVFGAGANPAHSATFDAYAAMLAASRTGAADAAFARVEAALRSCINQMAVANNAAAIAPAVVRQHAGDVLREWLVNELFTNRTVGGQFPAPASIATLAERYTAGRLDQARRHLADASGQSVHIPDASGIGWQTAKDLLQDSVRAFFEALAAPSGSAAAPVGATQPPASGPAAPSGGGGGDRGIEGGASGRVDGGAGDAGDVGDAGGADR